MKDMFLPLSFRLVLFLGGWAMPLVNTAARREYACTRPTDYPEAVFDDEESRDGYYLNDEVWMKCREKYYDQRTHVVCRSGNAWSDLSPKCILVECPVPGPFSHGTVKYGPDDTLKPRLHSWSRYECDEGYVYSGNKNRTCQRNGKWDGKPGYCKEKASIHCQKPQVLNSLINPSRESYGYKASIIMGCLKGYSYNGTKRRSCEVDDLWSGEDGACNKIHCDRPPENRDLWHKKGKICDPCPFNTSIEIACEEGYIYRGSPLRCGENGTWNDPGNCTGVICRTAPNITNGYIKITSHSYKDTAVVVCNPGYENDGSKTSTCQVNGEWSRDGHCISSTQGGLALISLCAIPIVVIIVGLMIWYSRSTKTGSSEYIPLKTIIQQAESESDPDRNEFIQLKIVSDQEGLTDATRADIYQQNLQDSCDNDINLEDIIKTDNNEPPIILMQGRAGVGKTTLVREYVRRWCQSKLAQDYDIIVLNARYMTAKEKKENELADFLSQHSYYNIKRYDLSKGMKNNGERLIVFMDAIDEFPNIERRLDDNFVPPKNDMAVDLDWCVNILKRNVLQKCTLVIMTRHMKGLAKLKPHKTLEVIGLTKVKVMEFVEKNVNRNDRDCVRKNLRNNPALMSVSSITFFCKTLCEAMASQDEKQDFGDLTTYTRITTFLIERYLRREMEADDDRDLQNVCPQLRQLFQLAYNGILQDTGSDEITKLVFSSEDLTNAGIDYNNLILSPAKPLITTSEKLGEHDGQDTENARQIWIEFVHLSIQEVLAMCHLVTKDINAIVETLKMMWTRTRFSMAQLYLMGLLCDPKCRNLHNTEIADIGVIHEQLQHVFTGTDINISSEDVTADPQQILRAIQMAYESQSPELSGKIGEWLCSASGEMTVQRVALTALDMNAINFIILHSGGRIQKLTMREVPTAETPWENIANGLNEKSMLRIINLEYNIMDNNALESVAKIIEAKSSLKELRIGQSKLKASEQGMKAIMSSLGSKTSLQKLSMDVPHLRNASDLTKTLHGVCQNNKDIHIEFQIRGDSSKSIINEIINSELFKENRISTSQIHGY